MLLKKMGNSKNRSARILTRFLNFFCFYSNIKIGEFFGNFFSQKPDSGNDSTRKNFHSANYLREVILFFLLYFCVQTVGEACRKYSYLYNFPRGLSFSPKNIDEVDKIVHDSFKASSGFHTGQLKCVKCSVPLLLPLLLLRLEGCKIKSAICERLAQEQRRIN